jgi:putative ATP-dependent endonuclease of OLD family
VRVTRVTVKNFRNLRNIDIQLGAATVIVGENGAGKSNLLHALRLVLDPGLSGNDRHLSPDDFWSDPADPGMDPMLQGEEIAVSVEVTDFDTDPLGLLSVSEALVTGDPTKARLTYRFGPRELAEGEAPGVAKYRWRLLGGSDDNEKSLSPDLRSYLSLIFLGALRDADHDLAVWRRSPLSRLLLEAAEATDPGALEAASAHVRDANKALTELPEVQGLAERITSRTDEMVGQNQSLRVSFGVNSPDPARLLRTLRVLVDGVSQRPVGTASLGSLNILYLALLELGVESRIRAEDLAHALLAIEEPEAHLHPHLQRLIFRRLLGVEYGPTTIVTTHSPHIASASSAKNLLVLRTLESGETVAFSAADADLAESEWLDVDRYLDTTRSELVFARGVLFVEGFAEQALVPPLAASLGMDLDKLGITVCAIHGTHFTSYVKFARALGIPWAVLTDGDPNETESLGDKRATRLVEALGLTVSPTEAGIFVGPSTFEYDLYGADDGNAAVCAQVLRDLGTAKVHETVDGWSASAPPAADLIKVIESTGGKGRFAQRLARERGLVPPQYLGNALRYLCAPT